MPVIGADEDRIIVEGEALWGLGLDVGIRILGSGSSGMDVEVEGISGNLDDN